MDTEIWKDIKWWEWLYKISSMWRVFSYRNNKIISLWLNIDWYFQLTLYRNWFKKNYRVNRLVAENFLDNYKWYKIVMHINNVRTDNRLSNIKWWTQSENVLQAYREWRAKSNFDGKSMRWKFWDKHHLSKGVVYYDLAWNIIWTYGSILEASRSTWVPKSTISATINWIIKTPKHIFKKIILI